MTMLSFKQVECNYMVRKSPANEVVVGLLIFSLFEFWICTVNMVLSFQFEFKMAVPAALMRKKICEVNNF